MRVTTEGHVMSNIYSKGRGRKASDHGDSEEEIFSTDKARQHDIMVTRVIESN